MREIGTVTKDMERAMRNSRMEIYTKETLLTAKPWAKESSLGLTVKYMMVNGKME